MDEAGGQGGEKTNNIPLRYKQSGLVMSIVTPRWLAPPTVRGSAQWAAWCFSAAPAGGGEGHVAAQQKSGETAMAARRASGSSDPGPRPGALGMRIRRVSTSQMFQRSKRPM